ncbi:VCBS repeat-containing protein [Fulvivirgaceae bacterium BMA10]|uniref:VCBS repeat-containing protein n=1 Tax=Splendidivirga corallicola TaxID=3051826 RepID=A0ABT8KVV3_9BACT|nr:VCBS repeat-containing protein [Fulvivirgaceae bacterium BMA10]
MNHLRECRILMIFLSVLLFSCAEDDSEPTVDLKISPSSNADARSSYTNAKTDILVNYSIIPSGANSGNLRDAIAYLDANGDGVTDVFMATGEFQLQGEVNSILAINDGQGNFTSSTTEFNDNMPPATHARKSIVTDFNNDGLDDVFVFDHGFDANPFPGNNPKLIIQNSVGSFSWTKLSDQTGFHHGGAAADVDNDGDIDVFVGGFDPFFYINDGAGNLTKVDDRFDKSIQKIFTAELIDVDEDGFVDLLVGAHEQDGDVTSVYWGSTLGTYSNNLRTSLPAFNNYGTVLDLDAEDLDADGDRDLIVNRTGGGNSNFYIGSRIQLLSNNGGREFVDVTNKIDNPGSDSDAWFPWIRIQDIDQDGDLDFFPDNRDLNFTFINDGNGNFTRQ